MFELAKELLTEKKMIDQQRIEKVDEVILSKTEKLQLERSQLMQDIKAIDAQLIEIEKAEQKK